ncbi:MAG: CvpA family protein [Planctomycetota bacterium]|nr:CvpA family protein [Planctomycetota bacterium]
MWFDLILGIIVLLAALRGWVRGFMLQSIKIGGMVGCVYAADPLREQAKPYILAYLPKVSPDFIDRILWWTVAVCSYLFLTGVLTLIVKLQRRQNFGEAEADYIDQFGGLLLGTAKGLLIAAVATAGIDRYGLEYARKIPDLDSHLKDSRALVWNATYHPAERVWESQPVRAFVGHIKRMGITKPLSEGASESPEYQTAAVTAPKL